MTTDNSIIATSNSKKHHTSLRINQSSIMSMSYSAPTFEAENLEKEVDELDDKAKEERSRDLYGSSNLADVETPEQLAVSLEKLHAELEGIDEKAAYMKATERCPDYASSLLLPFLRAELFDAAKAARRMVTYWEEKLRLFGEDKTFKPLTERDIGENGRQVILDGGIQVLPKDEHGRAVLHGNRGKIGSKKNGKDGVLKAVLYMLHMLMDNDVSAQQTGYVLVAGSRSEFKIEDYNRMMMKRAYHMMQYAPIRFVAVHSVYSSTFLSFFLPSILWLMGPTIRSRYIEHYTGHDDTQVVTTLASYGLTQLPVVCGGAIRNENEAFLEKRRIIERLRCN